MALLFAGFRILIGLLPVFAFLLALILLDSFKLVKLRMIAGLIIAGGLAAAASLFINVRIGEALGLDGVTLVRYVAPVVEELFKSAVIVYLIARHRVAFLVDAAIGYRLPKRFGIISLQVKNLFDKEFNYQDDSYREFRDEPSTGPYFPERTVLGQISVNF